MKRSWRITILSVFIVVLLCFGSVILVRAGSNEKSQSSTKKESVDQQEVSESSMEETEALTEDQTEKITDYMLETVEESSWTYGQDASPITELVDQYLEERMLMGEKWAISIEDLSNGQIYDYQATDRLQSASVIKVFIMGAVYDRILEPSSEEKSISYEERYETELDDLITQMITVSDNDCANRLVEILGEGDFYAGAEIVNDFCQSYGYLQTHMGRRFLDTNPSDDNYISAKDCRCILSDIYHRELVSENASEKMEELLQNQTRKGKIPAGLSEGFSSANKTGEMTAEYGLGSIENDMAIVYSPNGDYILVVISNDLEGRNSEAISTIQQISAYVARWYVG